MPWKGVDVVDAWWKKSTMTMTKATQIKKGDRLWGSAPALHSVATACHSATLQWIQCLLMQPSAER